MEDDINAASGVDVIMSKSAEALASQAKAGD
jgi:hypothetical protein